MRQLDMALLLGGPARRDLLEFLVDFLNEALRDDAGTRAKEDVVVPDAAPDADWPALTHPLRRIRAPALHVFEEKYKRPQVPVILTGVIACWQLCRRCVRADRLAAVPPQVCVCVVACRADGRVARAGASLANQQLEQSFLPQTRGRPTHCPGGTR
jgi:hypothetical protein